MASYFKLNILLLSCVLALCSTSVFAQSKTKLDSLDAVIASRIADTARVNTLIYYSSILSNSSAYHAQKMALQALALSRTIRYKKGAANALFLVERFRDNADARVSKKQWSDTLERACALGRETQDHSLLALIAFRKAELARADKDSASNLLNYAEGLAECQKAKDRYLWLCEKKDHAEVEMFKGKYVSAHSILEELFDALLRQPDDRMPLVSVAARSIACASLIGTDPSYLKKTNSKLQQALSFSGSTKNIHREAQLHEALAVYDSVTKNREERTKHLHAALSLYRSAGAKYDIVRGLESSFGFLSDQGKKEEALLRALEQAKQAEANADLFSTQIAYAGLGWAYQEQKSMALSAQYFAKAKTVSDELGYVRLDVKSWILNVLSYTYIGLRQFAKARVYLKEALNIEIQRHNELNVGMTLNSLGNSYYYGGQPDSALQFYQASDRVYDVLKLEAGTEDIDKYTNIALAFSALGQADSAMYYANRAYQWQLEGRNFVSSSQLKNYDDRAIEWNSLILSGAFLQKKNYDSAVYHGEQALSRFEKEGEKLYMKLASDVLWQSYKAKGDYVKALECFEKHRRIRDTLESNDIAQQTSFAESSAELTRREHEIELLKRDGQFHEAQLKEQELIATKVRLENLSRLRENQSLATTNLLNKETIARLDQEQKTLEALAAKQIQENKLLTQEKEMKEAEAATQRLSNLAGYGGTALMGLFAFVLFRSNRQKNKQNMIIEQEREKSDALLLNVLPTSIAARLKAGERNIADHYDSVSILFADIVGFTPLAARYAPREMVALLNALYTRFDRLTEQYGVERIKTIGDAYMVVSGAPDVCADHAQRISNYALKMMEELSSFSHEINESIQLRIGISSGEAVGAVVGEKKFAYDLWSDAVNTASRMESHGESGKIHCSKEFVLEVQSQAPHKFTFSERAEMDIKGKGMMRTYFLEATTI